MSNSIELTRKIYEEVMNWYKSAESKAQILLGVLGTFTGILTALILGNPKETSDIINGLGLPVIVPISLAFVTILYGVFACYNCLKSRVDDEILKKGLEGSGPYPPFRLMFFGFHANHEPGRLFDSLINVRSDADEISVYSPQIIKLSENVAEKHKWVNRGFVSISISIVLLVITTVLYLIDLKR